MNKQLREKTAIMREGGQKLARVKQGLVEFANPGVSFEAIEALAQKLINQEDSTPSFSTVPGYDWATCITKNEGCCHGVPRDKKVEIGDVLTIDVGLVYQGYHVDTTTTFFVGETSNIPSSIETFLKVGNQVLEDAIAKARVGNNIYDISLVIQEGLREAGFSPVYQLTGHAIGRALHEDPQVPCIAYKSDKKHKLFEGQTLAIEVMYAEGDAQLVLGSDGWTYETKDKSLTGMLEDTVLVTSRQPEILTRLK